MVAGLLLIGLVLIATALKNTEHELAQQLQSDVLGAGGFAAWAGAILAIGAIGYVPGLRTTSRYLLALVGVVIIVRNNGVWANAQAALQGASAAGPAPSIPTPSPASGTGTATSASSGSSAASTLSTVGTIAALAVL
jgi:hypothetical protein